MSLPLTERSLLPGLMSLIISQEAVSAVTLLHDDGYEVNGGFRTVRLDVPFDKSSCAKTFLSVWG
jgi:hypothetical protein